MSDGFIDRHLLSLFLEEAKERTVAIESGLLKLEKAEDPSEREESLLNILRIAHSLKGASGFVEMRAIEQACHWMEDVLTAVKIGKKTLTKDLFERLLLVNDAVSETVTTSLSDEVDETLITKALASVKGTSSKRVKADPLPASIQQSPDQKVQDTDLSLRAGQGNESIRISLSKLDALLYRSEELLRSKERLLKRRQDAADLYDLALDFENDHSKRVHDHLLSKILELVDNLDEDYITLETATFFLESEVRRARTQSFQDACIGLSRVVRDACDKSGKLATLVIDGDHVEIDQSIVQGMNDILRHLVRNAVDHGIESPKERASVGKPPLGVINITFQTAGDRLRVCVKDDGQGMPLLREVSKTREGKGASHEIEDRLLMQELFRPGYSTAGSVTKLSGRGVGLDVVKRTVERLRGYLEVSLNEAGGTTFIIVLPLSLTVTRGLMFNVGAQRFAIETATARRLIKRRDEAILRDCKKVRVKDGNREIPAVFITDFLHGDFFDPPEDGEYDVVMIGEDDKEIAVLVNFIAGEQELLVRPLGPRVSGNRKYNGAATLASGEIILILNPVALQEAALGIEAKGTVQMYSVLVVDDSPTVRNAHRRALEEKGFSVNVTVNGSEAWEILQTSIPDVIVADVDMPVMDGVTLAKAVRADRRFDNVPIILVTSRAKKVDKDRIRKAKVDAYIVKSSPEHEHLGDTVSELLKEKLTPAVTQTISKSIHDR